MRSGWLALALLLAPVAGAAPQAAPHAEIDAVYATFRGGYADLDVDRVASLYASDAIYVSGNGAPLIGREAVARSFKGFFDPVRASGDRLVLRFRIIERRVHGDAAWDLGLYQLSRVRDGVEQAPGYGRFVTGLRRGADGHWQFVLDSFQNATAEQWDAASGALAP